MHSRQTPRARRSIPRIWRRSARSTAPAGTSNRYYALADTSTGSSGHGISAGLGFAVLHRSCGLATRAFVIAGDAETEEGMTYEARNIASALGIKNLVVTLDYNQQGIDGPIFDAMPSPFLNHWFSPGWNIIEVDGHNVRELAYAYRLVDGGFGAQQPTVVICHAVKGKHYGKLEGTSDSHGTPLSHPEYVEAMKKLGFDIPGKEGDVAADIRVVVAALAAPVNDYLVARLQAAAARLAPEPELQRRMETALPGRPMADYRTFERPATLPSELVFKEGSAVPTRKASEAWFEWAMKNTAFFYVGSGDLMKSILTGKAENVYGVIGKDKALGRGLRFGIAEQNMAMMSAAIAQDTLPGGFRPMSAFATYGVFTPMMANSVRMTLINNDVNPRAKAFFIMLAAHDGPETGEDGPTHHGLFWMSLFTAYPGIKVYKPLDANETVEMLFHAAKKGEPVAFSVARPPTPVLERGNGIPPASRGDQGRLRLPAVPRQREAQARAGGVRRAGDGEPAQGAPRHRGDGRREDRGRHVAAAVRGAAGARSEAGERDPLRRRAAVRRDAPQRLARLPVPVPAAGRSHVARHRDEQVLEIRTAPRDLPATSVSTRRDFGTRSFAA